MNTGKLEENVGKEVAAIYQWRGPGCRNDPNYVEMHRGFLKEISDEGIVIEFTDVQPIVEVFGKILGHKIPFDGKIGKLLRVYGNRGEILYQLTEI